MHKLKNKEKCLPKVAIRCVKMTKQCSDTVKIHMASWISKQTLGHDREQEDIVNRKGGSI